jgi:hypothetical protein
MPFVLLLMGASPQTPSLAALEVRVSKGYVAVWGEYGVGPS